MPKNLNNLLNNLEYLSSKKKKRTNKGMLGVKASRNIFVVNCRTDYFRTGNQQPKGHSCSRRCSLVHRFDNRPTVVTFAADYQFRLSTTTN